MWFNGFMIVIDMALAKLRHPLLTAYRDALVLGSFREDVCFVAGLDAVVQSPSLAHFRRARLPGGFIPILWPDAAARTHKFAQRAVRQRDAGNVAAAMVQLGRAVHPLIDMSCPVHAQGIAHTTDPFEWCVEAMGERLRALPIPDVPVPSRFEEPTLAVAKMAQGFAADATNSPWGRLLKRAGWRCAVNHTVAREQAAQLVPAAAAHAAALFDLFLASIRETTTPPSASVLDDTLATLEMSKTGLRRWFSQLRRFCAQHGDARHYAAMLQLLDRCTEMLGGTEEVASIVIADD